MLGRNSLYCDEALKPLHTEGLRFEDLRHPADVYTFEEQIFSERNGLFHCRPLRLRPSSWCNRITLYPR